MRLPYKNLAMDQAFREHVQELLVRLIPDVRDNRSRLEDRWARFYRIYNCELDMNSYSGRSKIFLPASRATIETWVSMMLQNFFPNENWFSVVPVEDVGDQIRADTVRALLMHYFTKEFNLKSIATPMFRQLCIYGTSPAKIAWRDLQKLVTALVRTKEGGVEQRQKNVKIHHGPILRPLDLFNYYVWPETADNVQEAEMAFNDMEVTLSHIKAMSMKLMDSKNPDFGYVYEVPDEVFEGYKEPDDDRYQYRRERLLRMGINNDPSDRWSKLTEDRRNLTEVHWTKDLDGSGVKDWLITLISDYWVVRIQENPLWNKQKPYIDPRLIRVTNEYYGRGIAEITDRIQYMLNDIVNQSLDSVQYELNPITLIDPARVAFPQSLRHYPGAKWLADPEGIRFTQPASVASIGFSTLNMLQGFIHDFSGASAALQGVPAVRGRGRAQNTATGMQTLVSQNAGPITQVVEDLEAQFGVPLLKFSFQLTQQFMEQPVLLRILGLRGAPLLQKKVDLEDIVGDYEFRWLGSTASRNRMILGQQMINFANVSRGFPPQILQQMNWQWLIKKIWTEGLGLGEVDEMFTPQGYSFSVDPKLEFELLQQNREVRLSPGDNDLEHIKQHYQDGARIKDPAQAETWDKHIQGHEARLQQMIAMQQQQMMMQQMQALAPPQKPQQPQNQPSGFNETGPAALMQQLQGGGMQ